MERLLSGCRVLAVEDEMPILKMIEDMLADLGCESVSSAGTIRQALALIKSEVFDFAMLNMTMDGTQSHEVAEALGARGVPFVFSRGNTPGGMWDKFRDRFIRRRPYKDEDLADILPRLRRH